MTRQACTAALIDLDGTLIGRDEKVSPRVAQAVSKLAAVMPVSISSGREPVDVLRFAAQFGLHAPQVSDNGAVILDPSTGNTLHTFPMPVRQAEEVVRHLDARRIPFIATHDQGTFKALDEVPDWDLARVSALDLDHAGADVIASAFVGDPDMHVDRAWLPYNGLWAVDFTRVGVDKGSTAHKVAGMLGVAIDRVVAVGDSYNDISMLRECGLAIAMGDAPDEVMAVADRVVPSIDEDGLAVAIEEIILPATVESSSPSMGPLHNRHSREGGNPEGRGRRLDERRLK